MEKGWGSIPPEGISGRSAHLTVPRQLPTLLLETQYITRTQLGALKTNWPILPAYHAGRLAVHWTPVDSATTIGSLPAYSEEPFFYALPP